MNNLVYFGGNLGWFYDCDSFLDYWGCDYEKLLVIFTGLLMIMIVSWAIENNLVYLRSILAGSMIVIVSWAVWK